ncbi:hypothetical protein MTR_1g085315 [Medicago truncatula]|uniref:Uncharacterized protein n=1 Tax=Medicago truncatula TaxID=3880 RepID=A0A072VNZ0_MEDTR|nr:hypothetical protein MTR_1g085315 [Medicago truncatula]
MYEILILGPKTSKRWNTTKREFDTLFREDHRDEAITYSPPSANIDQQLVVSAIPDVVQCDIEVLRESWVNMAHNDEVHKKKKNKQNSQAKANKRSYTTRLRVGAPKSVQLKL